MSRFGATQGGRAAPAARAAIAPLPRQGLRNQLQVGGTPFGSAGAVQAAASQFNRVLAATQQVGNAAFVVGQIADFEQRRDHRELNDLMRKNAPLVESIAAERKHVQFEGEDFSRMFDFASSAVAADDDLTNIAERIDNGTLDPTPIGDETEGEAMQRIMAQEIASGVPENWSPDAKANYINRLTKTATPVLLKEINRRERMALSDVVNQQRQAMGRALNVEQQEHIWGQSQPILERLGLSKQQQISFMFSDTLKRKSLAGDVQGVADLKPFFEEEMPETWDQARIDVINAEMRNTDLLETNSNNRLKQKMAAGEPVEDLVALNNQMKTDEEISDDSFKANLISISNYKSQITKAQHSQFTDSWFKGLQRDHDPANVTKLRDQIEMLEDLPEGDYRRLTFEEGQKSRALLNKSIFDSDVIRKLDSLNKGVGGPQSPIPKGWSGGYESWLNRDGIINLARKSDGSLTFAGTNNLAELVRRENKTGMAYKPNQDLMANTLESATDPQALTAPVQYYSALRSANPAMAANFKSKLSPDAQAKLEVVERRVDEGRAPLHDRFDKNRNLQSTEDWNTEAGVIAGEISGITAAQLTSAEVEKRLFPDGVTSADLGAQIDAMLPGEFQSSTLDNITRNIPFFGFGRDEPLVTTEATEYFKARAADLYKAKLAVNPNEALAREQALKEARLMTVAEYQPVNWNGQTWVGPSRTPTQYTATMEEEMKEEWDDLSGKWDIDLTWEEFQEQFIPIWNPNARQPGIPETEEGGGWEFVGVQNEIRAGRNLANGGKVNMGWFSEKAAEPLTREQIEKIGRFRKAERDAIDKALRDIGEFGGT